MGNEIAWGLKCNNCGSTIYKDGPNYWCSECP
jgi:rRNA maturation endonuclease Nob1